MLSTVVASVAPSFFPKKWKPFLQMFRVHTASATFGGVLLGYFLAGGGLWDWRLIWWFWFAVAYHAWGFLQNNLIDLPHDRKDPNKQHFPLVTGEINKDFAWYVDWAVLIIIGLFFIPIVQSDVSDFLLFASLVLNTLYNMTSKNHWAASFFICFGYGFLPLISFSGTRGFVFWDEPTMRVFLVLAFALPWMFYQQAIEGGTKDITSDKVNFIKHVGGRLENDTFLPSKRVFAVHWFLRFSLFLVLLVALAYNLPRQSSDVILLWLLIVGFIVLTAMGLMMLQEGPFNRPRRLSLMARQEVLGYSLLILSFSPVIGLETSLMLIILPVIWFAAWNRFYWGTTFVPQV